MSDDKVIVVSGQHAGLPYSKGLRAADLMVTGLSPVRAYQIAEQIEDRLREGKVASIGREELDALTVEVLSEAVGERHARNFLRWQDIASLERPLVVLIGGSTGVGKSTIATQLAARLGVVRVVASDAIREVMRAMFSPELMPTIYTSSFEADAALREPPPRPADPIIVGFREQTAAVSVGVHALIERAAVEGTSLIVEGAHIVPGFFDLEPYRDRLVGVPVVVAVDDEEVHRSHFVARSADSAVRPFDRYLAGFQNIRKIQKYVKSQALSHGVPIIPNYSLDQALTSVIDLVVERAGETFGRSGSPRPQTAAAQEEARR
jgi:2-phosphoglycerate kinase